MFLVVLLGASMVASAANPVVDGANMVEHAIENCRSAAGRDVDRLTLHSLLLLEIVHGVPERYRGMSLAAACRESGFSRDAVGDGGKAIGWFQMHPWWERYGVDRRDPIGAGNAWIGRIAKNTRRARRKGCSRPWLAAWAYVASGPKGWRCRSPRHWALLRKWRWQLCRRGFC